MCVGMNEAQEREMITATEARIEEKFSPTLAETPFLKMLFNGDVPRRFEESQDSTHTKISIPWDNESIDNLNTAAGVKKYLSGHFESKFGKGYCMDAAGCTRMIYYFSKEQENCPLCGTYANRCTIDGVTELSSRSQTLTP